MKKLSEILNEYGQAIRGDWGSIDGRVVKRDLGVIADIMRNYGDKDLPKEQALMLREGLGICLSGEGHWQEHCGEGCLIYNEEGVLVEKD